MVARKIRMKIEKTGNQEYDFLIEKGLLCVGDPRTNYDARDVFKKQPNWCYTQLKHILVLCSVI